MIQFQIVCLFYKLAPVSSIDKKRTTWDIHCSGTRSAGTGIGVGLINLKCQIDTGATCRLYLVTGLVPAPQVPVESNRHRHLQLYLIYQIGTWVQALNLNCLFIVTGIGTSASNLEISIVWFEARPKVSVESNCLGTDIGTGNLSVEAYPAQAYCHKHEISLILPLELYVTRVDFIFMHVNWQSSCFKCLRK